MYQTNSRNVKIDLLIRMLEFILKDANDERSQFQHQTILTFDRLELHITKDFSNESRFETKSNYRVFLIEHFESVSISIENFIDSVIEKISLYNRVFAINKKNEKCSKYRRAIDKKRFVFNRIKLIKCQIKKKVLYRDDQL